MVDTCAVVARKEEKASMHQAVWVMYDFARKDWLDHIYGAPASTDQLLRQDEETADGKCR